MLPLQTNREDILRLIGEKAQKYYLNPHDMITELMNETGLEEYKLLNIINEHLMSIFSFFI